MSAGSLPLGERLLDGRGPEFAELLETLGEAITVRDADDRFIYANQAAVRGLGLGSAHELLGRGLDDVLARFDVLDETGRPLPRAAIPSVRLLAAGGGSAPLTVQTVARDPDAEVHWLVLRASPLHDATGRVVAAVTVIEDVTRVKTAEIHTRVLAESGRVLAASLDYQQTLHNVAGAAVPALADWCLVELVEGPTREQVVVAHIDPERGELARRLRTLEPPTPLPASALHRVLASGEPELHPEIDDAHLRRVAVSPEQLEIFRALEIRSGLVVPMTVGARRIGAMSFFTTRAGRRLRPEDVEVACQLARRAAVAVDNARMHTTLGDVAATLQRSLLPAPIPTVDGWEIGALYHPAHASPRIEVGGDFYEVFDSGGIGFATIGDVTGHGLHAATVTSLLRHGARFASRLEPDPVAILRRLDEELRRRNDGAMASALCVALHDHSVVLGSAGHPAALFLDASGTVTEAPAPGPLLGAFPDSAWPREQIPVADGELMLLYTDGVSETLGTRDRFGTERLIGFLTGQLGREPQAVLAALDAELARFRGGPASDDVAALALRPRPA